MTRQLVGGYQELSTAALEERIRLLEYRVAVLTDAVRALRVRLGDGRVRPENDDRIRERTR